MENANFAHAKDAQRKIFNKEQALTLKIDKKFAIFCTEKRSVRIPNFRYANVRKQKKKPENSQVFGGA